MIENDAGSQKKSDAWLTREGVRIPLRSPFNIGRSSKCSYVIPDGMVSREHTLFQYNAVDGEWLLIDLGSTNGTYLNGQRINRPVVVKDGDEVHVGEVGFRFHEESTIEQPAKQITAADQTLIAIQNSRCWLLVADVKESTQLVQQLPQSEVTAKFRQWARECEYIVRLTGGLVNEYLGDGLLAFWRDVPESPIRIAEALRRFQILKSASGLEFRVICHCGMVGIGGAMSSGLEKLGGREVNFIFKIEKSAGITGKRVTLTEPAANRLTNYFTFEELGEFEVTGFSGKHKLFQPVSG